jgi:hypothetical protein
MSHKKVVHMADQISEVLEPAPHLRKLPAVSPLPQA